VTGAPVADDRPARFDMQAAFAQAMSAPNAPAARGLFALPEQAEVALAEAAPAQERSRSEIMAAAAYAVVGQVQTAPNVKQLLKIG
jgi:hypothetical protein